MPRSCPACPSREPLAASGGEVSEQRLRAFNRSSRPSNPVTTQSRLELKSRTSRSPIDRRTTERDRAPLPRLHSDDHQRSDPGTLFWILEKKVKKDVENLKLDFLVWVCWSFKGVGDVLCYCRHFLRALDFCFFFLKKIVCRSRSFDRIDSDS